MVSGKGEKLTLLWVKKQTKKHKKIFNYFFSEEGIWDKGWSILCRSLIISSGEALSVGEDFTILNATSIMF